MCVKLFQIILDTAELIIPISGFIIFSIGISTNRCHCNNCALEKLEVASDCCCCGEVGPAFGKPGFDRSIETIRCIRPSRTNLKLTGSMLSYKRQEWEII